MTTTREIPREKWRTFFDAITAALMGKRVEIEVASLDFGDQVVAEWMPLLGVTYDSRDDLFDVGIEGLELGHLIRRPRQVVVQEGATGIETVAIATEDGVTQVLRLRVPVMLPAPKEPAGAARR
jgi:hypothetical protein